MAYDGSTWNEATPTNSTLANEIDDVERDTKIGVRSRMQWEHVWPVSQTSTADGGYHTFITLSPQTGAPSFPTVGAVPQVAAIWASSGSQNLLIKASGGTSYTLFNSSAGALSLVGGQYSATGTYGDILIGSAAGGGLKVLAASANGLVLQSHSVTADPSWVSPNSFIGGVSDYGTSASASTAKNLSALIICYGQFTFSANGSQAITNLPFASTTSYNVTINDGYAVATNENIRAVKDSASQFTLYNDVNRACVVSWIAIGT